MFEKMKEFWKKYLHIVLFVAVVLATFVVMKVSSCKDKRAYDNLQEAQEEYINTDTPALTAAEATIKTLEAEKAKLLEDSATAMDKLEKKYEDKLKEVGAPLPPEKIYIRTVDKKKWVSKKDYDRLYTAYELFQGYAEKRKKKFEKDLKDIQDKHKEILEEKDKVIDIQEKALEKFKDAAAKVLKRRGRKVRTGFYAGIGGGVSFSGHFYAGGNIGFGLVN